MRAEHNIETIENMSVCVMRGFYDDTGEYREEYFTDIPLSALAEKAVARIAFEYDLSILCSKDEVLVVAANMQDIDEHQRLEGTPRFFHGLLHSSNTRHYDGYMCIAVNLKKHRKRKRKA
jgi:hypothetical protein